MEFIRARLGRLVVAVELGLIQSVLDVEQAQALRLFDPREALGQQDASVRHVGLLRGTWGVPCGVCLGEVEGMIRIEPAQVYVLPQWLRRHLPPLLYHACAQAPGGGEPIWMLDLRAWTTRE